MAMTAPFVGITVVVCQRRRVRFATSSTKRSTAFRSVGVIPSGWTTTAWVKSNISCPRI
jgi:hypothetical protein